MKNSKLSHCRHCGFERAETIAHQYVDIDDTKQTQGCIYKQVCVRCGHKRDQVKHDYGKIEYESLKLLDSDAKGNILSYISGPEKDIQRFCGGARYCQLCGYKEHVFDGEHEFQKVGVIDSSGCPGGRVVCRRCGSTRNVFDHDIKSTWVLTGRGGNDRENIQYGYTEYKCLKCEFTYRESGMLEY